MRSTLRARYVWLDDPEVGPRAVEAGECDRCGEAPRIVPLCGPTSYRAVCRDCAVHLGVDGWCEGHRAEGAAARDHVRALPAEWATVVRVWWVATGEVRLDLSVTALSTLPPDVRAALPEAPG